MPRKLPVPFAAALAVAFLAGCENSPPGAGVTNGPPPGALGAEDKAGVRTDLQQPTARGGDAAIDAAAEPAAGPRTAAPPTGSDASSRPASETGGAAKP